MTDGPFCWINIYHIPLYLRVETALRWRLETLYRIYPAQIYYFFDCAAVCFRSEEEAEKLFWGGFFDQGLHYLVSGVKTCEPKKVAGGTILLAVENAYGDLTKKPHLAVRAALEIDFLLDVVKITQVGDSLVVEVANNTDFDCKKISVLLKNGYIFLRNSFHVIYKFPRTSK